MSGNSFDPGPQETVTLYEDVQEFWVADDPAGGGVTGCGALHVMWEDLAEVRTPATDPRWTGLGVGNALRAQLLSVARDLGVTRVFCLTFEVDFFTRNGLEVLEGTPVEPEVCIRSSCVPTTRESPSSPIPTG